MKQVSRRSSAGSGRSVSFCVSDARHAHLLQRAHEVEEGGDDGVEVLQLRLVVVLQLRLALDAREQLGEAVLYDRWPRPVLLMSTEASTWQRQTSVCERPANWKSSGNTWIMDSIR